MRLLNSTTLKLYEFVESQIPPYAILSHTWGEEEVSFQELSALTVFNKKSKKSGFEKIKRCCGIAAGDGFEYAWVDTCCIDKTSSAELSEAINSMFSWYRKAEVCYAFLSDVPSDEDPESFQSSFRKSRWFRRGWTLQELIAPVDVQFLGRDWKEIGTKWNLQTLLSEITSIQTKALMGIEPLSAFSVAQKMSWVSNRETTRDEDIAYCMIGIFDTNMPMLYGEGMKAFTRLQEQILSNFDDDSIFAWWSKPTSPWPNPASLPVLGFSDLVDRDYGLLAHSPELFARSGNVVRALGMPWTVKVSLIRGRIRLEAPTLKARSHGNLRITTYTVAIRCRIDDETWLGQNKYLAILFETAMQYGSSSSSTELYVRRTQTGNIHTVPSWQSMDLDGLKMETLSVKKTSEYYSYWATSTRSRELRFRCVKGQRRGVVSLEAYPLDQRNILSSDSFDETLGLRVKDADGLVVDLLVSFQPHQQILTGCILEQIGEESLEDVYRNFVYGPSQARILNMDSLSKIPTPNRPPPTDHIEGTSNRFLHRHKSGAQTSVLIKKIGCREAVRPSNIKRDIFQKSYFHFEGTFSEELDKMAPHVHEKYLIELKLG